MFQKLETEGKKEENGETASGRAKARPLVYVAPLISVFVEQFFPHVPQLLGQVHVVVVGRIRYGLRPGTTRYCGVVALPPALPSVPHGQGQGLAPGPEDGPPLTSCGPLEVRGTRPRRKEGRT